MSDKELSSGNISAGRTSVTLITIVCALFVFVLAHSVDPMISTHPEFDTGGDHLHYIAMAEEPGGLYQAPFCFRLLMPTLARLMPFGTADSFYFLTVIFLVGTGVLVYYIVLETSGDRGMALAGIALFYSLSAGAKFCLYDFWLSEPALFFFGALSVFLLLRKRDIWLSVTLAAAVIAKESALFILPLVYTLRAEKPFDRDPFLRALAVGVLPLAAFAIVRLNVPSLDQPGPLELFRTVGVPRLTGDIAGLLRGGTLGTWGVLIPALVIMSGRKGGKLLLRSLPFILLVYIQPLFAKNVDRLIVFAFPALLPAATAGLERLRDRYSLGQWMTGGAVVIPFVLTALKSGYNPPSPEQQIAVLAGWSIVVMAAMILRKKKTGTGP